MFSHTSSQDADRSRPHGSMPGGPSVSPNDWDAAVSVWPGWSSPSRMQPQGGGGRLEPAGDKPSRKFNGADIRTSSSMASQVGSPERGRWSTLGRVAPRTAG